MFSQTIPSKLIDQNNTLLKKNKQTFVSSTFKHSEYSTLSIIFYDNINDTQSVINLLSLLPPKYMRPKCLIVIFDDNPLSDSDIELMLKYAWSKRFLDSAVLTLDSNESVIPASPTIHYLNPFYNTIKVEYFTAAARIFPSKLNDLNGYPIKLPYANYPPFFEYKRRDDGKIEGFGNDHSMIKLIFEAMNFTINFSVEIPPKLSFTEMDIVVTDILRNGSVIIILAAIQAIAKPDAMSVQVENNCAKVVALVPVLLSYRINI